MAGSECGFAALVAQDGACRRTTGLSGIGKQLPAFVEGFRG